jgi:hypothetical protein
MSGTACEGLRLAGAQLPRHLESRGAGSAAPAKHRDCLSYRVGHGSKVFLPLLKGDLQSLSVIKNLLSRSDYA